jgi:hypothetical protein
LFLHFGQSASLTVCGDVVCNDDFHVRQELANTRDIRFIYLQTHAINAPNGVGEGFTASDVGVKIFLFWTVGFDKKGVDGPDICS